jgi:glucoamylase
LDWVVTGWATSTCDLWEELTSSDFFWNRVTMKKALIDGAAFALLMGDEASGNAYSTAAAAINATLYAAHWSAEDGGFVYESTNRMKDGAVIVGFNDGYTEVQHTPGPLQRFLPTHTANRL